MSIFDLFSAKSPRITKPQDPKWVRSPTGRFHHLMQMDPSTDVPPGTGGVFVIWHGGVRPEWVYFGAAKNIARAIDEAQDNADITQYEINGRLSVTWSPVREDLRPGVLLFLNQSVDFKVNNPSAPKEETKKLLPIPVLLPGARADDE